MKTNTKNIKINIEGMSCNNCAAGIKKTLEKKGAHNVNVNFSTGEVSCNIPNKQTKKDIERIITKLGYTINKNSNKQEKNLSQVEKYFYLTAFFTLPLFCHMFPGINDDNILKDPLMQFLLCLPVYTIGVFYFGKSAWTSLKIGIPNMDVLIFIGSTSAFAYSIYGWILYGNEQQMNNYLFFETSATIITLVLLGNVLEHKSVQKTTSAISDLSAIQKTTAKKEVDGKITEISFEQLKKNDILIVNHGDKIPTDGIILSGSCYIDESMITGEAIPVNKQHSFNLLD